MSWPAVLLFSVLTASNAPPLAHAHRSPSTVVIDGRMDDAAWLAAEPIAGFLQQWPDEGKPPTGATEARILYGDGLLYIGFHCVDPQPDQIIARLQRRDLSAGSDTVTVDIDTRGDQQRAYRFELSAAGVQRDAVRTGDNALAYEWDAVWQGAVARTPDGWSAELAIPFAALRYEAVEHPRWRIELRRYVARRAEWDLWAFMPRDVQGEMQRYGVLEGLEHLPESYGIVLQPFVTGKVRSQRAPADIDAPRGTDMHGTLGIDSRFALGSSLTLSSTVLPDFGQVESDPAILNLSTFEVRLPERRSFFLEGADLFNLGDAFGNTLGNQLFYSRRLGSGTPAPYLPAGATELTAPDAIRLWTAAKLTGRLSNHVTIALLDGLAARERAELALPGGARVDQTVSPLTNFLAGRLSATLGAGIKLGLSLTDVHRNESPDALGTDGVCPNGSAPRLGRCTHDAQSAGADLAWQSADGNYLGAAMILGSRIVAGPDRTKADGTIITSGDTDLGGRLELAKANGHFVAGAVYEAMGPKLDLNDAGYLRRQNYHSLYTRWGWRAFDLGPMLRNDSTLEVYGTNAWDSGATLDRGIQLTNSANWRNKWYHGIGVGWSPRLYDNREAGDGTLVQREGGWSVWGWGGGDGTRDVTVSCWGGISPTWRGASGSAGCSFGANVGNHMSFSLAPSLSHSTGDPRWLAANGATPASGYLFGLQDATSPSATFRSTITFTPQVTLQTYTQLFFANVRYSELYSATPSGDRPTLPLTALQAASGDPHQYDSRDAVLNVNVLFRWEYHPGSALFVVYTRAHAGGAVPLAAGTDGRVAPVQFDWNALARAPVEDVFLIKISHSFGT